MQKGKAAASPPAMILQNREPHQYPCCNIFEGFDELDLVFVTETESGLLSPVFCVTIDRSDIFKIFSNVLSDLVNLWQRKLKISRQVLYGSLTLTS